MNDFEKRVKDRYGEDLGKVYSEGLVLGSISDKVGVPIESIESFSFENVSYSYYPVYNQIIPEGVNLEFQIDPSKHIFFPTPKVSYSETVTAMTQEKMSDFIFVMPIDDKGKIIPMKVPSARFVEQSQRVMKIYIRNTERAVSITPDGNSIHCEKEALSIESNVGLIPTVEFFDRPGIISGVLKMYGIEDLSM